MLNVREHLKFAIRARLTFAVFKFGECHIWRSIFVCKYYIWRIQGASRNSLNKVLTKIKHSTVQSIEMILLHTDKTEKPIRVKCITISVFCTSFQVNVLWSALIDAKLVSE